jgi:hypothetical protein
MKTQRSLYMAAAAGIFIAAGAGPVSAQWNAARYDSSTTWVFTSYGLDPSVVGALGIARSVPVLGGSQISAEAGWVVAGLDVKDYRGRVSAKTTAVRWRSLRLTGEGSLSGRGTSNSIYRAVGIGAATTWTLGVYRPRWFAGTEAGYDKNVATHLNHTNWYRSYFYPDAKDGWYGSTGGTIHYGLTGGVALGPAEFMSRAGFLKTERLNDMTPPMYVTIGVGFRLM